MNVGVYQGLSLERLCDQVSGNTGNMEETMEFQNLSVYSENSPYFQAL